MTLNSISVYYQIHLGITYNNKFFILNRLKFLRSSQEKNYKRYQKFFIHIFKKNTIKIEELEVDANVYINTKRFFSIK